MSRRSRPKVVWKDGEMHSRREELERGGGDQKEKDRIYEVEQEGKQRHNYVTEMDLR